ncbi:hypothetical protein Taro_021573 [Colocasia esculenta]|uniref:Uncharacterized protein n=1 Tax=Colocasia esculenta TaxID=4460 RepID=A0A843V8L7_COLES|nr:hypothetical protein [Colocasia esculenta]
MVVEGVLQVVGVLELRILVAEGKMVRLHTSTVRNGLRRWGLVDSVFHEQCSLRTSFVNLGTGPLALLGLRARGRRCRQLDSWREPEVRVSGPLHILCNIPGFDCLAVDHGIATDRAVAF